MGQQSSKPSNGGSDGKDRGDGGRDRPSSTNQKEDKGRDKGKGRGKVQRRPKMRLRGHREEGTDIPPMVPIPRIARTPSGRFVVDESLGWDGHGFRTEGGQQADSPVASTYPVPPVLWEDMGVEPRAPSTPTTMTAATNPAAPVAAAAARAINDEHGEAVPPSSPAAHPLRSVHSFGTSTARGWCAASSPAADPLDGGQPSTNTATTGGPSASSRPRHARRDFVVHAQPMTAEYAFLRGPEEQPGPIGHSRPVQEAPTGQQHTRRHRHEQRQQEQQEQQQQQPPSLPHQHHVQQQQQQQQEEQQNPGHHHHQQQSPSSPSVRRRHPRLRDMVEYMQRRTRRQQQTFSAADPWRREERSGDRSQGRVRDGQQQQAQAAHGVRTSPSLEPGDLPPRLVQGRVRSNYGQAVAALPSGGRPIERPVTPFDFAPLPTGGAADTGLGSGSPDPGSPGVPAISPARGRHAQAASTATVWDDVVSTAQQAFGSPNREFQSRGIRIVTPPEDIAPVAPMPLDRLPRPASVARPPSPPPPAATEAGAAQGECVDASRPVSIVGPLRSAHGQMTIRDRQRIASAAGVPFSPLPRDVASTTATTTSNVPTSSPAAVTAAGPAASRSAVSVAAAALATEQLRQFHQEQQSESGSASGSNGSIGSSTWSFGSHRPGSPDRLAPFPEHLLRRQSHMMYREREQRRHRVEQASRGAVQGERQEEGGRPSLWSGIQRMRSEMQLAIEREDGERAEREAREAMRSMSTDTLRLPPGRRRGMRR